MKVFLLIAAFIVSFWTPVFCQQGSETDSTTITVSNPALGFQAELAGLLQWPKTTGRHPLVVFIHGSGKGTRYEYGNMFDLFLKKGYAVFSYDKRGVNKSTGIYNGVGAKNSPMMIPLLASDAYEGIEMVKRLPQIDSSRIILVGGSQAGWIMPVVAFMNKSVSHFVSMFGPTVSVGEEIYYSSFAEHGKLDPGQAEKLLKNYSGLRGFDPWPYLVQLNQKGLWLYGGLDESIPTHRSLDLLDSLEHISPKHNTVKLYPQAAHGLKNVQTGLYENYIPVIMDWLDKNVMNGTIAKK